MIRQHERRKVGDSEIVGIAQVEIRPRLGRVDHCDDAAVGPGHQRNRSYAGLLAIPVDGYWVLFSAWVMKLVTTRPSWALIRGRLGVEYPDHADVDPADPAVREGHSLCESLRLVVDASRTDRMNVSPVILGLPMSCRVAVHLACRGEQEPSSLDR